MTPAPFLCNGEVEIDTQLFTELRLALFTEERRQRTRTFFARLGPQIDIPVRQQKGHMRRPLTQPLVA